MPILQTGLSNLNWRLVHLRSDPWKGHLLFLWPTRLWN